MKFLVVDNDKSSLKNLCRIIESAAPEAELRAAKDSDDALEIMRDFVPDVVFLEIRMPEMNGLELARIIRERINPRINIIFTTGHCDYIETAFMELRASGYLLKPVTKEMVTIELENLRYPLQAKEKKQVQVRTFGEFEIYVEGKPLNFRYKKTKELCAFLVDRGRMCSMGEIQEYLWEETDEIRNHGSYLQNLISDLRQVFGRWGCGDVIIRKYGAIGFDVSKLDCDYYAYRDGNPAAVEAFRGEYMTQYYWGEKTLAGLVFSSKHDYFG